MELDPPKEMAKVRRYGRYAQACCLVLFVILAIAGPVTVLVALFVVGVDFYVSWPSIGLRAIGGVLTSALAAVAIAYLYALFGDLGRGQVYTVANVRRIRRVGVVLIAFGALEVLLPLLSALLLGTGVVPPEAMSYLPLELPPQSLLLLLAGSLVVLCSWILEVGRRTTEDAARLRSEAELTV
jgi:hypothetical protein